MKPQHINKWLLLVILLVPISIGACLTRKDSPAPGCIEWWLPPLPGGCFGKTAILDLRVEPEMSCLEIDVNNCNGGILEVTNDCAQSLVLGGVEIEPSDGNVGLDVRRENGEYRFVYSSGNFSEYTPQQDERIEVWGTLGAQEVRVSFTKTRELC